jgi:MinD-like ATPase involved in chromosome partitioning or flagellar assembly
VANTAAASATIREDGTAEVEYAGSTVDLSEGDVTDARHKVLSFAREKAADTAENLHITIADPTGEWALRVLPSGDVEEVPTPVEEPARALPEKKEAAQPAPAPKAETAAATSTPEPLTASEPEQEAAPPVTRRDLRGRAAEAFSETKKESPTGPAELGWQGAINKASGGALKLAPGPAETRMRQSRRSVQRGLNEHKTVAFINLKGGVGKTSSTYLTGATFGRVRGGSVLAWDDNENKGTLGDRAMQANHDHTAIDLLEQIATFDQHSHSEDLVNFVRPQGENHFDVLASQNKGSSKSAIDGEGFTKLHATLRRFYRLILVDTGNASNADTWQGAVAAADVLVICTLNKEDAAKTAAATIDTLEAQGYGDKVANAVVVISEPQTPNPERKARIKALFGDLVREVVEVPFDKHLDEGEEIEWHNLSPQTQEAFLHVTAAITDGL